MRNAPGTALPTPPSQPDPAQRRRWAEALLAMATKASRIYRRSFSPLDSDDRDDVVQDVVIAWLGKLDLGDPMPPQAAINASFHNRALDLIRRRPVRVEEDEDQRDRGDARLAVEPEELEPDPEGDARTAVLRIRLEDAIEQVLRETLACKRERDRPAAAATADELRDLCFRGVPFDLVLERSEGGPWTTEKERVDARNRFYQRHATFRKSMQAAIDAAERRGDTSPGRAKVLRSCLLWLNRSAGHLAPRDAPPGSRGARRARPSTELSR